MKYNHIWVIEHYRRRWIVVDAAITRSRARYLAFIQRKAFGRDAVRIRKYLPEYTVLTYDQLDRLMGAAKYEVSKRFCK